MITVIHSYQKDSKISGIAISMPGSVYIKTEYTESVVFLLYFHVFIFARSTPLNQFNYSGTYIGFILNST